MRVQLVPMRFLDGARQSAGPFGVGLAVGRGRTFKERPRSVTRGDFGVRQDAKRLRQARLRVEVYR